MQAPANPQSHRWMMVHWVSNGAFGHIHDFSASGFPVVKFVGCNTLRICLWDEIMLGQRAGDP